MNPYYELAYALASESLCLFVGTGFSKFLTHNRAPDWQTLLIKCCDSMGNGTDLKEELFPGGKAIMPLEECASVISLQMKKIGASIYDTIAKELEKIESDEAAVAVVKQFAQKHPSLKFITTNYDSLIQQHVLETGHTTFCPGFPINRQRIGNEVHHIHGSINHPRQMVVTADDYYKFINFPNYFSKKLDTLLEENSVVIIGYSLGDINFKSILNSHRFSHLGSINRQHLFFLSRKNVPQHVKDYYDSSYGLRVIEETEISSLLGEIDAKFDSISKEVKDFPKIFSKIISGELKFEDLFLRQRASFAIILATISSTGIRIDHPDVLKCLENAIRRKHKFTSEDGAWDQYDDLAEWLIQLGCVMDLEDTPLKDTYLSAVTTSFETMSRTKMFGKSWDAYRTWNSEWGQLTFKNRVMVRSHVQNALPPGDFNNFIDK